MSFNVLNLIDILIKIWSFVGSTGWIFSKLKEFLEPKPDLKVEKIEFVSKHTIPQGELELHVVNKGNSIATEVYCIWIINRKDNNQRVANSPEKGYSLENISPHSTIIKKFACNYLNPKYDYEIWILLKCNERIFKPIKRTLKIKEE